MKISGTLLDSQTNKPVAQGWAVLESGAQHSIAPLYSFSQVGKAATGLDGFFSLCAPTITLPSVVVLLALDAGGKAYPAFVDSVTGTSNIGTIPMGGCGVLCFLTQQQTTLPASIAGTITSAPVANSGTVTPNYAMAALDGSKSLWDVDLSIPGSFTGTSFATTAGVCAGNAPFCAIYKFQVPSQNPLLRSSATFTSNGTSTTTSGFTQQVGTAVYSIYAVPAGVPSCLPSFADAVSQRGVAAILFASPGAQLTATDIVFTSCQ